jgi:hypothetical protein
MTKVCSKCKVEKDEGEFYFNKRTDKTVAACKLCSNKISGQRSAQKRRAAGCKERDKNKIIECTEDRIIIDINGRLESFTTKVCYRCNIEKTLNNFQLRHDTKKYKNECKECVAIRSRDSSLKRMVYYETHERENIENTKICKTCNIEKQISEFHYRKDNGKYRNECIQCWYSENKQYRKEHKKETIIIERTPEEKKKAKELKAIKRRIYYVNHMEQEKAYQRNYSKTHKNETKSNQKETNNERYKTDILYKLRKNFSNRIRGALKNTVNTKNGKSIIICMLYTILQLKQHLESLFEWWMNWDNWGRYNAKTWDDDDPTTWTWQIDHIIPHSRFHYTSMEDEDFKKCWALENLRPYSAKKNNIERDRRYENNNRKINAV